MASYAFRGHVLDVEKRLLLRGGRPVALQPKVFDLLHFLILHRERVVPKDVLIRELWSEVCVTASSLTRLVKEARRAVGDDGRAQHVIETVQRVGYRFTAEIEVGAGQQAEEVELAIDLARRSLESALERGASDLRARVRDYAETCLLAVQAARRIAG